MAAPAGAQDFYKGKTISFIIGSAPGGGYDTYSRLVAAHIGKHLPGNPAVVPQNMPGANSTALLGMTRPIQLNFVASVFTSCGSRI